MEQKSTHSSFGSFFSFLWIIFTSSFSNRYVKRFISQPKRAKYNPGRSTLETAEEKKMYELLLQAQKLAPNLKVEWKGHTLTGSEVLKYINEHIFLVIKDLNDLKFTVHIDGEKSEIKVGWDTSRKPTLVVPLNKENIYHVAEMFGAGKLGAPEMYRIAHFIYLPALESFYHAPVLQQWPENKSYLRLDNFIHVELKNEHNVRHDGKVLKTEATVLNVDGQWLVFAGLHGDPDVKYSATLEQTIQYHHLILHKATSSKTIAERKEVYDEYVKLRKKTLVYERNYH